MLTTGLKVYEFKPGQGDGFLRVIICSTPSFRGDAKPDDPML
jgi:hypothetical protein